MDIAKSLGNSNLNTVSRAGEFDFGRRPKGGGGQVGNKAHAMRKFIVGHAAAVLPKLLVNCVLAMIFLQRPGLGNSSAKKLTGSS